LGNPETLPVCRRSPRGAPEEELRGLDNGQPGGRAVTDLLVEADYYARDKHGAHISRARIEQGLDAQEFRGRG